MRLSPYFAAAVLGFSVVTTACDRSTSDVANATGPAMSSATSAPKFWDVSATAYWNQRATALAAASPTDVSRLFVYLSMAQFRAAEAASSIRPHAPYVGAISAASVAVLTSFFPTQAASLEAELVAQAAADPWPGAKHQDFAQGATIGRAIAARVLSFAAGDRVGLANPGLPPAGPGYWIYNGGAMARGNYRARPFFLESDSVLRPAPPPAFGSPAYLTALAEVRQISDTRTAEQLAIATYWNLNQSPRSIAAWTGTALQLIREHRLSDAKSAELLFRMYAASFDAFVGCFDAKYHYWFIRPPQADPGITLPIGLPPHPSYPSAHSCSSGAVTGVLAAAFEDDADWLAARATESSLSRLYGGIHYRFDMEAGLALGRGVAAKAVQADLSTVAVLP